MSSTAWGVKKPLALVSRTLLEEGIIERIGGKLEAVIQSDIPKDSSFSLVGQHRTARPGGGL